MSDSGQTVRRNSAVEYLRELGGRELGAKGAFSWSPSRPSGIFSVDCMRWAEQMRDPGDRQSILDAARRWTETANAIERHVSDGRGEVLQDLKQKLN